MASMRDVAELAGVSISTVSRVISGRITVDGVTAERVRDAIDTLDFRLNLLASGLRSRSGKLIGLLVPGLYEPFASIIGFLEYASTSHGYSLLVGNSRSRAEVEERFIDNLIGRNVDGIIFSPVSHQTRVLKHLLDSGIPVVWFDRVWEDPRVLTVQLNNKRAGWLAGDYLASNGHQYLSVVTGPPNVDICDDRLRGFQEGIGRYGIKLSPEHVFEGDFSFDSGLAAVDGILALPDPVSAVWAQNDLMAIGLLKGFLSRGVRVPQEMSIVGMDGIPFTQMVNPEITTISQPLKEMCDQVLARILNYQRFISEDERRVTFEPELLVRQSVREI